MAAPEALVVPKWQVWTGWVLSCLPLLAFLPSATFKLVQPGGFLAEWSKNYPPATARPIGVVELSCVVLYFIPSTRVLGAILLTGYLGGAVATHVRAGEAIFVVPLLIGVILWGGLFLRDPRLRELLPKTKPIRRVRG
ncbi:MAG: DoxX family protein [Myxococcota bacterium]|nr:DoxX family protein [Myxococcota bacterium]